VRHILKQCYDLGMAVDTGLACICAAAHILQYLPYHPHNTQKMINMLMRYKNLSDIGPCDTGAFKLVQQADSSAPVHQKIFFLILKHKAGIIAFRNRCIAGAQHYKFHFFFFNIPFYSVLCAVKTTNLAYIKNLYN